MKRVFAFAGFSSALALLLLNIVEFEYAVIVTAAALILLVLSLVIKSLRQGKAAPIAFGAALFSCLVFMLTYSSSVEPQFKLSDNNCEAIVEFEIVDIPIECDYGWRYTIKTRKICAPDSPQSIKTHLYTREALNADYYDTVYAKLRFQSSADNAISSYGKFGENVFLNSFLSCKLEETVVVKNDSKPIGYYIITAREWIFDRLDGCLGRYSGLPRALLTGDSGKLPTDVLADFKICGVSHIIVVSGLHVMILSCALLFLLKLLRLGKIAYCVISVPMILFYMGIAGFSKSVTRAGIMLIVMLLSQMLNRKADSLNSLGFSVFIICLNPFAVCDAGAVLTVSAVLGLVVLNPFIRRCVANRIKTKNKAANYVINSICVTASVFVSTLPAVQILFGSVSALAFLTNIVFVLFADVLIILSVLCVALGSLAGVGATVCVLTVFVSRLMIGIAGFFADTFSFLYLDISNEIFAISIAAVIAFVGFSLIFKGRVRLKHGIMIFALLMSFSLAASIYVQGTTAYVAVSPQGCVVAYNRDCAVVIDVDAPVDYCFAKQYLNNRKYDAVLFVDCEYDRKRLTESVKCDYIFAKKKDFTVDLCDDISVKYDSGTVYIKLYDSRAVVTDDFITVNNYRTAKGRDKVYNTDEVYLFSLKDGCDFQLVTES